MKYLAMFFAVLLAAAIFSVIGGGTSVSATKAHAGVISQNEDPGSAGGIAPCNWQNYGVWNLVPNPVYGLVPHICRYAGGLVVWVQAASSWVYTNSYVPGALNACVISPSCYIYAYVPA